MAWDPNALARALSAAPPGAASLFFRSKPVAHADRLISVDPRVEPHDACATFLPLMNSDNQPDDRVRIYIEGLEIQARIGVTDEERAAPQRLVFNITLWPKQTGLALEDKIERTVDYAAVCAETQRFVQARSDRLIETLADALATRLLELFAVEQVTIELRKFILPDVEYVAVSVTRTRAEF